MQEISLNQSIFIKLIKYNLKKKYKRFLFNSRYNLYGPIDF